MKTRLEADEVAAQLERCDKENKILKDEMNKEIEAVPLPCLASLSHPVPWLSVSFAFTLPAVDRGHVSVAELPTLPCTRSCLSLLSPLLCCFSVPFSLLVFFFLQFL